MGEFRHCSYLSKRKKKRREDKSSCGSSSSASGSSSNSNTLDSQDSSHPFKEGHRMKQLARKHPGLLTRHALEEMARILVEQGTANSTSILPLYLKYFRLEALRRDMTPGHRREITTLAHALCSGIFWEQWTFSTKGSKHWSW